MKFKKNPKPVNFFIQNSIFYDFFNEIPRPQAFGEKEILWEVNKDENVSSQIVDAKKIFQNSLSDKILQHVDQKVFAEICEPPLVESYLKIFSSFVSLPCVGTILCVFYFDNNFVKRFFWGFCTRVVRRGSYSFFSMYQKLHGFSMTFFTSSPFFIGFIPILTSLPRNKYIRKSRFFL